MVVNVYKNCKDFPRSFDLCFVTKLYDKYLLLFSVCKVFGIRVVCLV
jgi:hypothetical protein